jgi:hypothetical protein
MSNSRLLLLHPASMGINSIAIHIPRVILIEGWIV